MPPEEVARQQIDVMLRASGWGIQEDKALKLEEGRGIPLQGEVPLKSGRCDSLLLVVAPPPPIHPLPRISRKLDGMKKTVHMNTCNSCP